MIRHIADFFLKPYPFYIPFSRSFGLLIILSLIIPLFLIIFQPFKINSWECDSKVLVLGGLFIPIYLTLAFNFHLLSRTMPTFFNESKWSIGRELIWSAWNFISIVLATSLYWTIVPFCEVSSIQWGQQFFSALLIGILPGSFCIYFNYSRALRRKLKRSEKLNKVLKKRLNSYESETVTLKGESKLDIIRFSSDSLLYIQSQDNYSKVLWLNDGEVKSVLIRSSLKSIEDQISLPDVVRCHRSYIINLRRVVSIRGNAREYRLLLDTNDITIPVSRDSYKSVVSRITALYVTSVAATGEISK